VSGCAGEVDCGPCSGRKGKVTWTIKQGSLLSHKLHVIDTITGSNFNLTGFGVRAALRYNALEKGSAVAELTGAVISPATKGWIRVSLGATATRLLLDHGRFDVEVYKLDDPDIVYRVMQGRYVVDPEITD
jgi:hypothetical protein